MLTWFNVLSGESYKAATQLMPRDAKLVAKVIKLLNLVKIFFVLARFHFTDYRWLARRTALMQNSNG